VQQHHTKLILKRRDLLTDGGLLNAGLTGGRRKRARFSDA
jgi:hypothetical protein